jgi:hypothetical protein
MVAFILNAIHPICIYLVVSAYDGPLRGRFADWTLVRI